MAADGGGAKGHDYELKLDLGGEQILLTRVDSTEALGKPFQTFLEIVSAHTEIDLVPHLGKLAIVKTRRDGEEERYFTGYVIAGEFLTQTAQGFHYRLELAPGTYFLDQNRKSRTFHQKTAKAIITQLGEGLVKIESRLGSAGGKEREYIAQYEESDFAFLSRLMEREGIYYFWEHGSSGHKMILADGPSSHPKSAKAKLEYSPTSAAVFNADIAARTIDGVTHDFIQNWHQKAATLGQQKVTIRAFPIDGANTPNDVQSTQPQKHEQDIGERFEYHAGLDKDVFAAMADDRAKSRLTAMRAERALFAGRTQMVGITAGSKVEVHKHDASFMNGTFTVVRTTVGIVSEHYRSGEDADERMAGTWFEAIPADTPFKVDCVSPIPNIAGLHTGLVTHGADGTEEYGRVKVKFPWDMDNGGASRWCRVSQHGGMGNIVMPRVDEEVLVAYLNGDPDYPVVVGHVFNSVRKPAYKLPDFSYRAVWRNENQGGGGAGSAGGGIRGPKMSGVNELSFENKSGAEEILLHAIRNLNTRVHENETHFVSKDQEIQVDGARKVTVQQNETIKVTGSITETADGEITIESKTKLTLKVGSSTIELSHAGIKVNAMTISEQATISHEVKAVKIDSTASAMMTLKGTMIMIN